MHRGAKPNSSCIIILHCLLGRSGKTPQHSGRTYKFCMVRFHGISRQIKVEFMLQDQKKNSFNFFCTQRSGWTTTTWCVKLQISKDIFENHDKKTCQTPFKPNWLIKFWIRTNDVGLFYMLIKKRFFNLFSRPLYK